MSKQRNRRRLKKYDALIRKGILSKYSKKTHEALEYLTRAIKLRPNHYEAYLQKGITYFQDDHKDISIQYIQQGYNKCKKTMTKSQKKMMKGLLTELVEGDNMKAMKYYKDSVKYNRKNDFSYNAIGYIYHINEQHGEAIKYYKKAVNTNPKYSKCIMYCNMALCYEKIGKKKDALKSYKNSIRANPKYLEAYTYRSQFHAENGNLERAKKDIKKILEIDPLNSLATALMGDVYVNQGKNNSAYQQYVRANLLNPTHGSFWEVLSSWELHQFHQEGKAIALIEKGLRLVNCEKQLRSLWEHFSITCKFLVDKYKNSNKEKCLMYKEKFMTCKKMVDSTLESYHRVMLKNNLNNQRNFKKSNVIRVDIKIICQYNDKKERMIYHKK